MIPFLTDEQLEALQTLLPQVFSEDRLDLEKFVGALGILSNDRSERYSFS